MSLAVPASPLADPGRAAVLVFVAALSLRLALIFAYPALFGGDSIVRLANADKLFLSYQLPGLQAIVWLCAQLTWNPLLVRVVMALIAAAAAVGFHRLSLRLLPPTAAFGAALWFGVNPFILTYSIVPYQEILMLGALAFAFAWRWEQRPLLASAALAVACLTRYEAWLACPVFVLAALWRNGWRSGLRAALLYGWAPALWIAFHHGLTPSGGFAVDTSFTLDRLHRWLYLAWITLKNTPPPVAAAAAWGLYEAFRRRRDQRLQELAAFLALFAVAVLLSAHGERGDPDLWVTAREAHIPLAAAVLAGGLGLSVAGRWRTILIVLGAAVGVWMAQASVAQQTSEPHVALSYRAARWLDANVGSRETAVVLSKPIPAPMLERFLGIAEERGARSQALRTLLAIDAAPPDRQRILVQSRMGPERLLSFSTFPPELVPGQPPLPPIEPDWLLIWSDFEPSNPREAELARRAAPPTVVLQDGAVEIRISRLQ